MRALSDPGAIVATTVVAPDSATEELAAARRYAEASRASTPAAAYHTDWRAFSTWCAARGLDPSPPIPA